MAPSVTVKLNFRPYIRRYTSPNENFEYSYSLITIYQQPLKRTLSFEIQWPFKDLSLRKNKIFSVHAAKQCKKILDLLVLVIRLESLGEVSKDTVTRLLSIYLKFKIFKYGVLQLECYNFETHCRQSPCVVSLSKTLYSLLSTGSTLVERKSCQID